MAKKKRHRGKYKYQQIDKIKKQIPTESLQKKWEKLIGKEKKKGG